MASSSNFDEARRKLDDALHGLETPDDAQRPDAPAPPPLRPAAGAAGARVAPRRRSGALHFGGGSEPAPATARVVTSPAGATPRAAPSPGTAAPGPAHSPGGAAPGASAPRPPAGEAGAAERDAAHTPDRDQSNWPSSAPAPAAAPTGAAPAPTTATLTRLLVGAALLGLAGLAGRSGRWSAAAGLPPGHPAPAAEGEIGSGRFRHALVGWVFETEEQLRPRGNPIIWLREVVRYSFATVFSVVVELLPLPRLGARRARGGAAEPTDEDTRRWIGRGRAEEEQSRRFARAALEDILDSTIVYLARRPGVQRALGEIVRSPAMDDAVAQIIAGPVVERAIERITTSPALDELILKVAQSPALDQAVDRIAQSPALERAVARIVRTPAMEDAVNYLVRTPAMEDAIATLSQSPALVDLVTTQTTSVAAEILEEVRERAVSGDKLAEGLVRRLLRRRPRSTLPVEARGLLLLDPEPPPRAQMEDEEHDS